MAIVCGTDFSQWSISAARTAAALAGALGQSLHLVHVLEPHVEEMDEPTQARVMAMLGQRLDAEARTLKAMTRGEVDATVLPGHADEVVRAFAVQKKASLIVVGSAGHGASPLFKLGGNSERLATATDIPVLVVRDDGPFTEWRSGRALRVLVGVDDTRASGSAVRWAEALRRAAPTDVVLGCVYYADDAHRRFGLGRRFSYTDADPEVEALIEQDLKRRVPHLEGAGETTYRARLGLGRVADHLLELAEAERCDLVVVGSHGRRGLARMWSVSAAALHLARMAVAVVPPDGKDVGAAAAMPTLKRVLVTTDFSPLGDSAIPWAYAVVAPHGEVFLGHVTQTAGLAEDLVDQYLPPGVKQTTPRVEAEVAARLRALTPTAAQNKGCVTRTEVMRHRDPAEAILEAAARLGVDAIVLASHGRSGVLRSLSGSVAEAVLRRAHRPVFIVRPPEG